MDSQGLTGTIWTAPAGWRNFVELSESYWGTLFGIGTWNLRIKSP